MSDQEAGELDIAIGLREDPADEALAALREHQEAMGMKFSDPDAEVSSPDSGVPGWMTRNEEL
jgi:hypothetical protein